MWRTITCIFLFSLVCCVQPDNREIQVFEANLFLKTDGKLSEGPVWNQITNELYWVDIESKRFHLANISTQQYREIPMPSKVGMVIPVSESLVLVGLEDGLYSLNLHTGTVSLVSPVDHLNEETRLNDRKCDPGVIGV